MQATVQTTWFGIDRIKFILVATGILVTGLTATTVLSLTDINGDEARSAARDIAIVEPAQRPMDRGGIRTWERGTSPASTDTSTLDANGLPIAPAVVQAGSSGTAHLEANGLPTAPAGVAVVESADVTAFLEQNTQLPVSSTIPSRVMTTEWMRFLAANATTASGSAALAPEWSGMELTER